MEELKNDGTVLVGASEQDRFLPIANIGRIMKDALPKDTENPAKIAKDARETV